MELEKYAENFGLGEVKEVSLLNSGFQNSIYKLITDKGEFCIRVYNDSKGEGRKLSALDSGEEEIRYELKVLDLLSDLEVIQPIEINGDKIVSVGSKNAIVYPYVEGKHVDNPDIHQVEQAGSFMGKFHDKVEGFSWEGNRFEWYNLPDSKIEEYLEVIHESEVPGQEELPRIIKELKENRLPKSLPSGAIHIDYSPANTLYDGEELAAVLDFDNSYIGPLVLDIGKGVMFFSSRNGKFDSEKMEAFLDAYEKERPLSDEEKEYLDNAIKLAFLSHVFVDYYMRAIELTTPEYFDYILNDLYLSYQDFKSSKQRGPESA